MHDAETKITGRRRIHSGRGGADLQGGGGAVSHSPGLSHRPGGHGAVSQGVSRLQSAFDHFLRGHPGGDFPDGGPLRHPGGSTQRPAHFQNRAGAALRPGADLHGAAAGLFGAHRGPAGNPGREGGLFMHCAQPVFRLRHERVPGLHAGAAAHAAHRRFPIDRAGGQGGGGAAAGRPGHEARGRRLGRGGGAVGLHHRRSGGAALSDLAAAAHPGGDAANVPKPLPAPIQEIDCPAADVGGHSHHAGGVHCAAGGVHRQRDAYQPDGGGGHARPGRADSLRRVFRPRAHAD